MASVPGATGSFLGPVPAITSGPEEMVPNPAAVVADEQTGGGGEDIVPAGSAFVGGADGPEEDTVPTRDLI